MDPFDTLSVLTEFHEEQQAKTTALLEQLQHQLNVLQQTTLTTQQSSQTLDKTARTITPHLQKALTETLTTSIHQSLREISETATTAINQASQPLLQHLTQSVTQAQTEQTNLQQAVSSFTWRWALIAGGIAAGTLLALATITWGTLWYQRQQIETLLEQKAQLQNQIPKLQATVTALEKRGGKLKTSQCGNHLCIAIRNNPETAQKEIWKGEDGSAWAIPQGY